MLNMTVPSLLELVHENKIEMVDFKFSDLFGRWHHLTLPAKKLDEEIFTRGEAFDSSSTPGFKKVESGDAALVPDPETAVIDPFWEKKTLSFICDICEPDTYVNINRDPRGIARRADKFLKETGIADTCLFSPEFEFYIFDSITYEEDENRSCYQIESVEADWSHAENKLGHKIPRQGGYHAMPPQDTHYNLRAEMVAQIQDMGFDVRYHHHEVGGPGQSEIEIGFAPPVQMGDIASWVKYIIKMIARNKTKTVTFMPKPLFKEAGNGMHFHQFLKKDGKNIFYEKGGYADLSQDALYFIGGLLAHGRSLIGLTNPSTNSFKRLVPGFEAPTLLFFGLANRSAAIRIPRYANKPEDKRFEFRPPDATCNLYLAMAAQLMAGLDGIRNKIDPTKMGWGPIDENVAHMPKEKLKRINTVPASLQEACRALEEDCEYLLQGGVFTKDIIETWTNYKIEKEYYAVRNRPHPYEMSLYFDV